MASQLRVELDHEANLGYMTLSDADVASTVELGDAVMVDLDKFGIAVGIEVLDLTADIPLDELVQRFHVHSDVLRVLRLLEASIGRLGTVASTAPGPTQASPRQTEVAA